MTVNFTTWKGITDGQTYDIPDIVVDNMDLLYWMDEASGTTVNDHFDEVDGTLTSDNWGTDSNSPTSKDEITQYDGTDDQGYSEDSLWVNTSEASFAFWVRFDSLPSITQIIYSSALQGARRGADTDGGFLIRQQDDDCRLVLFDSDGNTTATTMVSDAFSTDKWFFVAVSADGDNYEVTVWDETSEVGSDTHTESHRNTLSEAYLNWMGDTDSGNFQDGDVATVMAADADIDKSTWSDIWNDTKP